MATELTHGPLGRPLRFFQHTVWRPDLRELSRLRAFGYRAARITYVALRGFWRDGCSLRSAALTYTTLLSIVPLLAFAFSLLKGLGAYDSLIESAVRPVLDEAFGARTVGLRGALERMLEIVSQTRVSGLGVFGLVIFVVASLALLDSVETTFNHIWGARTARSPVRKLTDYIALVIITPIFVTTLAAILATMRGTAAAEIVLSEQWLGPARSLFVRAGLLVASWLGLAFVYFVLPNTRTPIRSVLLGGVVAGTLWTLLSLLHVWLQIGVANYNALYSGFAALPIFLAWLYASWQIVLLGAECAAAHRSVDLHRWRVLTGTVDQRFREILALRAARRIATAFVQGRAPWSLDELARDLCVPENVLGEVLEALESRRIFARLGPTGRGCLVPCRALETVQVLEVLEALRVEPDRSEEHAHDLDDERVNEVVRGMDAALDRSTARMTLRDLTKEAQAAPET